jgi:monothiol glutaredoxin
VAANPELKQKVEELLGENQVLLFMKGVPEAPRCGFSMRVVGVLEQLGVEYGAIDVLPLLDPLREVTGELADWRTFPQLYVNGELVGGCDIVEEMFESGELAELVGTEQPEDAEAAPAPAPASEPAGRAREEASPGARRERARLDSNPQQSPPLQVDS